MAAMVKCVEAAGQRPLRYSGFQKTLTSVSSRASIKWV